MKCPDCGTEMMTDVIQMRGGDEPGTIFHSCWSCGKRIRDDSN